MTPYAPAPVPDPELSKRALDTLELWAKVAGSLTALALFVHKILKPYQDWRRKSLADLIREVLKEELEKLDAVVDREEEVFVQLGRVLARQDALFADIDAFLEIGSDNRERLDEVNGLLDKIGLTSDRRAGDRGRFDELMEQLHDRRNQRRRLQDQIIRQPPADRKTDGRDD